MGGSKIGTFVGIVVFIALTLYSATMKFKIIPVSEPAHQSMIEIFIFAAMVLLIIHDILLNDKIYRKGVQGKGILKSCDIPARVGRNLNIFGFYEPIVGFYMGDEYYEKEILGNYRKKPAEVGEVVDILVLEIKESTYVMLKSYDFKKSYIKNIVLLGILLLLGIFHILT